MCAEEIGAARRWWLLAIALLSTMFANVFINGAAFLIPTLHERRGLDLAEAGLLSAMPSLGMVVTLIAWGYVVDRVGERAVLSIGSALTAAAGFAAAATADSLLLTGTFLLLGGMASASSNSASGRLVVGWFPARQRGVAMGIRQTAQPLGVALGALVIPRLAQSYGIAAALLFPAIVCALAALISAVWVVDPPRPHRQQAAQQLANPYRGSAVLWRIHALSVLLVIPQIVIWTFALVWLMADRGWSAGSAGLLVMLAQVLGALGRIAAGRWSDRVGSRLGPIRTIAVAAAMAMAGLALTEQLGSGASVALLVVASVVTVSDNGLAFTAIAEIAGPFWSGRALGTQNTSQLLTSSIAPPVFGSLIGVAGYPVAFLVCAVCPLLALPLVPVHSDPLRDQA